MNAAVLSERADVLKHYAAMHPPWETELQGWDKDDWAAAARQVTSKTPRLEFLMQAHPDTTGTSPTPVHAAGGESQLQQGHEQQQQHASYQQQPQQQPAQQHLPSLNQALHGGTKKWVQDMPGGAALFDAWLYLNDAVAALPARVQAEWRALRGAGMRQLLADVVQEQHPSAEQVRAAAKQQRLQELLGEHAGVGPELQVAAAGAAVAAAAGLEDAQAMQTGPGLARSTSGGKGAHWGMSEQRQQQLPDGLQAAPGVYPGLVELGVTFAQGVPAITAAASTTASGTAPNAPVAGVKSPRGSKGVLPHTPEQLAAAVLVKMRPGHTQHPMVPGVMLALARLTAFKRGAAAELSKPGRGLGQLLRSPWLDLVQQCPNLDPQLYAAWSAGHEEGRLQAVEVVNPWLGLQAVRQEVLEGLSQDAR